MAIEDVLSAIADKSKVDGLDLEIEKGRLLPEKDKDFYHIVKSKKVGFTNGRKCIDCGEEPERICRVVYADENEKVEYCYKDVCDACYETKYKVEPQTLHSCQNNCPSCTCKEKV